VNLGAGPYGDSLVAAGVVVATLLAAGGAGTAAWTLYCRGHHAAAARLAPRVLALRLLSYAALGVGLLCAVAAGTAGVAVVCGVCSVIAADEWARLFDLPRHHRLSLLVTAPLTVVAAALLGEGAAIVMMPGMIALGLVWPVIAANTERGMRDLGVAALGYVYVGIGLAHAVVLVRDIPAGASVLVAVAVATAMSDVAAFIVGRRFGRGRLAPRLSPNKTRAGVVGNLVGALVGVALFAPAFGAAVASVIAADSPAFVIVLLVMAVAIGLGAVWGDLFESAAKREATVKDAGTWLPGFGGLLDRIDSLLVTVPMTYWFLRLVLAT